MSAFTGFSLEDADFVEKFAKNFVIWMEYSPPVEVETNNNENDTIYFGEYSIIKDDSGKCQAYFTSNTYFHEDGPESVEVELDKPTSFHLALGVCAKHDFDRKLEAFFESQIPQESEPQG